MQYPAATRDATPADRLELSAEGSARSSVGVGLDDRVVERNGIALLPERDLAPATVGVGERDSADEPEIGGLAVARAAFDEPATQELERLLELLLGLGLLGGGYRCRQTG